MLLFMSWGDPRMGTFPDGDTIGSFEGAAQSLPLSGDMLVPRPPPHALVMPCPPRAPRAAFCSSQGR